MTAQHSATNPPTRRDPAIASAATQMAIDAHLLSRAAASDAAIFRVYRMDPPAITIGRHQRWRRVVDESACAANGWEWTRRPTGGGALLHRHELNYAIAAPRGLLAPTGRGEFHAVFAQIGRSLQAALRAMGFDPQLHQGDRGSHLPQHGLCGRSITGHELSLGPRKLIAAAQLIAPEGILQHGTIYIHAPQAHDRFWPIEPTRIDPRADSERWADLGTVFQAMDWRRLAALFEDNFTRHFPAACRACELALPDWAEIDATLAAWDAQNWVRSR